MYWMVSVYRAPDSVVIHRIKNKDLLIEKLLEGYNEDHSGVFDSLREVKEFVEERLPNFHIYRSDIRDVEA